MLHSTLVVKTSAYAGIIAFQLQSQIQRLTNLNAEVRSKVHILEQQAKSLIEEKACLEGKLEKGRSMTELQLKYV